MTSIKFEFNKPNSPVYFSPDFTQYLDFNLSAKFFKIYSLPTSTNDKKQFIKKEYLRIDPRNFPGQEKVY
jgi:hypothetical protein